VKRFAAAAAFAAGLHLLLFSLDVDRRSPRDLLRPSTETVTIVLNAAFPGTAEPRGLSTPPDSARQRPPENRPDGVSASKAPVLRDPPPKPVKSAARKTGGPREAVKAAAPAGLQPGPEAAEPPLSKPQGLAAPGPSTDESRAEDGGALPVQPADGRFPAASGFSAASRQPAAASVLQEATPEYDKNPAPEYPRRARQLGYEGTVLLNVRVDLNGGVEDVKIAVSSGHSLLDQSALLSVKAWRFKPARRGDQPVAAWVRVPVRYTLEPPAGRMP
jgi:periplasmic protein TonB